MAFSAQAARNRFSLDCFSMLSPPTLARSLPPSPQETLCTPPKNSLSMEQPPPENVPVGPCDPRESVAQREHVQNNNFDGGKKKYKIWVMEAQLPWDKSQYIMCNGNNPWPASGGRERRRSMIRLSRRVVDIARPATVPDEAAYIRGRNEKEPNEQVQNLWEGEDRAKDSIIEPALEDQDPTLKCNDPGSSSQKVNRFHQGADRKKASESGVVGDGTPLSSSKCPAEKLPSRKARISKTGDRSPSPPKMPGKSIKTGESEVELREVNKAEKEGKKKKKKPSTAPYNDAPHGACNPWIIDWDESKAIGFSPWGDNNEAKTERGQELCSYMKKVARNSSLSSAHDAASGSGDAEKPELKRRKAAKKRHKGKRNSARSRKGKSDNSRSAHRVRRTSSIKSNRSEQSSLKDREEQSYCPGEYEACAGVGDYEVEDPFDEVESVNMNEPSGWGADSGLLPALPAPEQGDDRAGAPGPRDEPLDEDVLCEASQRASTPDGGVESTQIGNDFSKKKDVHPQDASPSQNDGARPLEVNLQEADACSGCPGNSIDGGNDVNGARHDGEDGSATLNQDVQLPSSRMPWSELFNTDLRGGCTEADRRGSKELGLISKLTGNPESSAKKHFSARSLSRRSKRPSWDGSVSDRPFSRPSSNPCVSTFEPLQIVPRETLGSAHRSRTFLRGRPTSQPAGDVSTSNIPTPTQASHTETNLAIFDDNIGRVQMAPKRSATVQCRKIELPLKGEEDEGGGEDIQAGHSHTHTGQGILTFAPFFGSKVSKGKGAPESSRRSSCCSGASPRSPHLGSRDGHGKEKTGKDAKAWNFSLEDLGPETGEKKNALVPRHEARGSGGQTKGIGDCIDLLWKGIPRDSAAGFSRSGYDAVCKTIAEILGDDRFLDPEETWSKFALRKDSKQKSSFAMSGVMQAMGLSGVKGMFLHLARVVYRAGLAVDWGVLHDDLLSRLGKVIPRNTLSKLHADTSPTPARNPTPSESVPCSPPPENSRGSSPEARNSRQGGFSNTVKRSRKPHVSPDMLLQARAADRLQELSGSMHQHRSFIVLLPLSAARLDDVRWKQRTRGGRGSSPALPHTPLRHIRRTRTF